MSLSDIANPQYNIKHNVLVKRATKWVSRKYYLAIPEFRSIKQVESPDVIGFQEYNSVIIECKSSYSDFRADQFKRFRIEHEMGMGDLRYYFSPPGVIPVSELPNGWGLLYWRGGLGHVQEIVKSAVFKSDKRKEFMLLTSIVSRLYTGEFSNVIVDGASIIEPEELNSVDLLPKFVRK